MTLLFTISALLENLDDNQLKLVYFYILGLSNNEYDSAASD